MNTFEEKKPAPAVEDGGCGSYILRAMADDVDAAERESAEGEAHAVQIEPEEDFDEWLARKGPDDEPEPEDEAISPRESEELFIRGMLAFAQPISAAEGRAALRRTRQLRLLEARRASRHLATGRTQHCRRQARPRARSRRAAVSRRVQPGSRSGEEPGPHGRPEPVVTVSPARACVPRHDIDGRGAGRGSLWGETGRG